MINAKNSGFREHRLQNRVQVLRGFQVVSKRFFDDHARIRGAARFSQALHHRGEQTRRNRQVMRGIFRAAKRCAQLFERLGVLIVAINIFQEAHEFRERSFIHATTECGDAVARALAKLLDIPAALATPITGTFRFPRFTMACSAGKIFLCARSPVAPKKTSASDGTFGPAMVLFTSRFAAVVSAISHPYDFFSSCPPNSKRMAESSLFAKSASPREVNRSNNALVSTGAGVPSSIAA